MERYVGRSGFVLKLGFCSDICCNDVFGGRQKCV